MISLFNDTTRIRIVKKKRTLSISKMKREEKKELKDITFIY